MIDAIGSAPGVSSVALTTVVPMDGVAWRDTIFAETQSANPTPTPSMRLFKFVTPGLSRAIGGRLLAGREFSWVDVFDKRPVVMVSENLARELWEQPAGAIGKRVRENAKATWREVIGVVSDEMDDGVNRRAPATVLWPIFMGGFAGNDTFVRRTVTFIVRSGRVGTPGFVDDISRAIWSVNPDLPLGEIRTLQSIYRKSMHRITFALFILATAGCAAIILGLTGAYSLTSHSVSQRTRDIGIRRALGAQSWEILSPFLREGAGLTGAGIIAGLGVSMATTRLMSSFLFGVTAVDFIAYAGASLVLAAGMTAATIVPAQRATKLDPIVALRVE
jgi:putative ABC transport system permease protein